MTTSSNDDKGVTASSATLPPSIYAAGSGGATYKPSGVITRSQTLMQTPASTVETTLWSYTLPASTLVADGERLRIRIRGVFAGNANAKTVRFYFGASSYVVNNITTSPNNIAWFADVVIVRRSVTAQSFDVDSIIGSVAQIYRDLNTTEDLTTAILLKLTGENGVAAAADITLATVAVEYLP